MRLIRRVSKKAPSGSQSSRTRDVAQKSNPATDSQYQENMAAIRNCELDLKRLEGEIDVLLKLDKSDRSWVSTGSGDVQQALWYKLAARGDALRMLKSFEAKGRELEEQLGIIADLDAQALVIYK